MTYRDSCLPSGQLADASFHTVQSQRPSLLNCLHDRPHGSRHHLSPEHLTKILGTLHDMPGMSKETAIEQAATL
jgi:hypothetical protein